MGVGGLLGCLWVCGNVWGCECVWAWGCAREWVGWRVGRWVGDGSSNSYMPEPKPSEFVPKATTIPAKPQIPSRRSMFFDLRVRLSCATGLRGLLPSAAHRASPGKRSEGAGDNRVRVLALVVNVCLKALRLDLQSSRIC